MLQPSFLGFIPTNAPQINDAKFGNLIKASSEGALTNGASA